MPISISPNLKDLRTKILNWFIHSSGIQNVYWANQSFNNPVRPYATLNVLTYLPSPGLPEKTTVEMNNEVYFDTREIQDLILSVNFYTLCQELDNDALWYINKFIKTIMTEENRSLLEDEKIVYVSRSDIRNLDNQSGDEWEKRTQVDLTLRYMSTTREFVGYINQVKGEGTYKNDKGDSFNQQIDV